MALSQAVINAVILTTRAKQAFSVSQPSRYGQEFSILEHVSPLEALENATFLNAWQKDFI